MKTLLSVLVVVAVGMTASRASATYIVASDFNQTEDAAIDTVAPDIANLPGSATWFQTGLVGYGATWAFNKIGGNVNYQGLSNGTGISIASAGSYVKPTQMHIQADLRSGLTDQNSMVYARGVALGFYDDTHAGSTNSDPMTGFTGLVLANDGGLYVYTGRAPTTSKVAFGGTFNTSSFYTLGYDVNTTTGAISNVTLSGSTADYSGLTSSAFTNAATANLGFFTSSEDGGCYGFVDNVALSTVPEPSSLILSVCGLVGLLAYAWRKRK
jgi:hypothetical protein